MPADSDIAAAQGNNNSSDFVRKLYKMLEDPQYSEVVRWGDGGDSFVVLENEKFTKTILPKHFKHSNFASFVRQLNKYDFHKVRHNDETGQSPYGPSAWEFKHPEFRADRKDNLDNIRRKAPAPRKAQGEGDQYNISANQQVAALSEQFAATQHQVQSLQESYTEIVSHNKVFVEQIMHLQNLVRAQNQVHSELLNHLARLELDHKSIRKSAPSATHAAPAYNNQSNLNFLADGMQDAPQELRRARDILNNLSMDHAADPDLKRMSIAFAHQPGASPESAGSSAHVMAPPNSSGFNPFMHDPMNDMRHMVYPVGQTIGIDPFSAEHMGNIPYNRPVQEGAVGQTPQVSTQPIHSQTPPETSQPGGSPWGMKKPVILLVEDDKTCSRIGSKFLSQYDCGVEVARDGIEAVNKVNAKPQYYDLIFMDIVMPQLDGVSATVMIREVMPNVPIIAMTSNINQQDLEMYFHWGMRDVLAKPFTKEGMIGKIRRHLSHYLRHPPQENMMDSMYSNGGSAQPPTPGGYPNQGMNMAPLSAASSTGVQKFETTPIQSPATSASWHSPSQMHQASPSINQEQGGYLSAGSGQQMVMTPGGSQKPQQHYQGQQNHQGHQGHQMMTAMGSQQRLPDGMRQDGPPEKRQRMYAAPGGYQQ